jgi:hypothetical protein
MMLSILELHINSRTHAARGDIMSSTLNNISKSFGISSRFTSTKLA